jgi:predicted acyltransferase
VATLLSLDDDYSIHPGPAIEVGQNIRLVSLVSLAPLTLSSKLLMNPSSSIPTAPRILSLDALRGFDMFWILGADALVQALGGMTKSPPVAVLAGQLEHTEWAGLTFYDLIFPLFLFIIGVSLVFSLTQLVGRAGRPAAVQRIFRRVVLLFLFGILYNGGLSNPWPAVRIAGVLQRMALAYGAAGLLFLFCKPRTLAVVGVALLAGYWALLTFVPIRDFQLASPSLAARLGTNEPSMGQVHQAFDAASSYRRGGYEPGLNLTNHLDFQYLPGAMYDQYYDPEGILSTLPAVATCLLGVFAGVLLRRPDWDGPKKALCLAGVGVGAISLGWLWHLEFPVIKKLWTSSFVLVAGGWGYLLLAAFYYLIDVRLWRRWCLPFVWIGLNPITLYLASSLINFHAIASRLVGGSIAQWLDTHVAAGFGGFVVTGVGLGLIFGFARFLYQKKIFLRV